MVGFDINCWRQRIADGRRNDGKGDRWVRGGDRRRWERGDKGRQFFL